MGPDAHVLSVGASSLRGAPAVLVEWGEGQHFSKEAEEGRKDVTYGACVPL